MRSESGRVSFLSRVALACFATGVMAGCSSAPTPPVETPAVPAQQSLSKPGSFEPYVFGGERLVGRIVVLGISAADATVSIEGGCADVRQALTIRTRGWATGLFALLADSWVELDTTYPPDLGMPTSGRNDLKIAGSERHYTVTFRLGRYRYKYVRNGELLSRETVRIPEGLRAHDLHSAVLALRSWRPAPETRSELLAVMGRHLWRLDVVYKGPDVVMTASGPRPAVRIEGLATKRSTRSNKLVERKFFLWFSDDKDRVPLRALAESEFGPVELETTGYSCPGCTALCRVSKPAR